MPEPSDNQEQPIEQAPEQGAAPAAETPSEPQSLADELSAARAEDPETPVEGEVTPPAEDKPAEPTEPVVEAEKPEPEAPAEPVTEPAKPDLKSLSKEERAAYFIDLQNKQKTLDQSAITEKIDEHYKPQDVDELKQKYLDAGRSDFEAEMLADRDRRDQQAQLNDAKVQIIGLNSQINGEALKVMHDFPVFDPDSADYDKGFADRAAALYRASSGAVIDQETGLVVSTNVMPHNFYKELAELRDAGLSQATITAQRNAESQLASVTPSGATPPPTAAPSAEDSQAQGLETALNNVK